MKVLSLFDGISCARVALQKAGISVEAYYASEIDVPALKISQKNWPEIIQLGDVKTIHDRFDLDENFGNGIDLLIGGSPCQDLSIMKKNRQGLEGSRSGLFWEYVRILKEVKPKYFILENVASMPEEAKEVITKALGVFQPIMINASLVSAQSRKRLFWTNIKGIQQPKDRDLYLQDVMQSIGEDITTRMNAKKKGTLSFEKTWGNIRMLNQKAKTLTASGQNISNSGATNVKKQDGRYYKLTPIECERLQGLPDRYTEGVSDAQRYKMLGNAFNADVVAHILSFIKRSKK